MVVGYEPGKGLTIADSIWLAFNTIILIFEIFIIVRYLIPLRIKSPYILLFYSILTVLMSAQIMEVTVRIYDGDPGLITACASNLTLGVIARQISAVSYILLGFVLSTIMFQLSVSLALVLNIIDLEEANQRKITYNICIGLISVAYIVLAIVEY